MTRACQQPLLRLELGAARDFTIIRTSEELYAFGNVLATCSAGHTDELTIHIDSSAASRVDAAALGRFVAKVLQIQLENATPQPSVPETRALVDLPSTRSVQVLTLHEGAMDAQRFACLCSALPHTRSIRRLELVGERLDWRYPWRLRKLEPSWLASKNYELTGQIVDVVVHQLNSAVAGTAPNLVLVDELFKLMHTRREFARQKAFV